MKTKILHQRDPQLKPTKRQKQRKSVYPFPNEITTGMLTRSRYRHQRCAIDRLPIEIIRSILSKLPVKWVFISRSVCKTWCSLIDHSQFPEMHLNSQNDNPFSSFIFLPSPCKDLYIVEQGKIVFGDKFKAFLLGSCNGLLCFCDDLIFSLKFSHSIYISNPTRQECVKLPLNPPAPNSLWIPAAFGFGFDHSTKEFKLILSFLWFDDNVPREMHSEIQLYNLGLNSWKKLVSPDPPLCGVSQECVNGSGHWIGVKQFHIISFDFKHETFGIIPFPKLDYLSNPPPSVTRDNFRLQVLKGWLSLSNCCCLDDHFEIWVLQDYIVKESWTKLFVIGKHFISGIPVKIIRPICLQKNGELLLLCDFNTLVSYNPQTGIPSNLGDDKLPKSDFKYSGDLLWCKAFPFSGSLISPKSVCKAESNLEVLPCRKQKVLTNGIELKLQNAMKLQQFMRTLITSSYFRRIL